MLLGFIGCLLVFFCSDAGYVASQGRNAGEQVKMIQQVEKFNAQLPDHQRIGISVEIEKTREPLYELFPYGDVVRNRPGSDGSDPTRQ